MELRYKCLILDHDDTAVESTLQVHYPAHLEAMRLMRPHLKPISLEGWFLKNFDPGIMNYLSKELGMTGAELETEYRVWRRFTESRIPLFFPGFRQMLQEYRQRGGIITVVSHSESDIIEKHYRANGKDRESEELLPDMIFGWVSNEEQRKPSPFPVERILETYHLDPSEALVVDDLKPGVTMSKATGVPVVAAGWGHRIPQIRKYMEDHCLDYFETVAGLSKFILA